MEDCHVVALLYSVSVDYSPHKEHVVQDYEPVLLHKVHQLINIVCLISLVSVDVGEVKRSSLEFLLHFFQFLQGGANSNFYLVGNTGLLPKRNTNIYTLCAYIQADEPAIFWQPFSKAQSAVASECAHLNSLLGVG